MHVKTEQYVFSHGKSPRGKGNWWFRVLTPTERVSEHLIAVNNKTYSAAKREVIAKARKLAGVSSVLVCP